MTVVSKSQEGKKQILEYYDFLLKKISNPYERLIVDTSYGKTFILAMGKKDLPALILLHGSGMNSSMWIKEMEEYSKCFRVYAIDTLGEPGRSDEVQLPFKTDDLADWLNEVFHGLSIEKASIVGISLGGWLGTKFSIKYNQKVDKLVLLCPSGIGPQKKSFIFKFLLYSLFGEKGINRLYYKINGDKPIPEIMLQYQKLIAKYFNFRKGTIPIFSDQELSKLTMSVALFVGGKDIMLHSEKTAKRLERLLGHAKINFLAEEGHSIVNQGDKVREFLRM